MPKHAEETSYLHTLQPAEQAALGAAVRAACEARRAIYPIGGGTSLGFGLPIRQEGIGLSLAGLNRVIDYPARDMTITVEAGITIEQLAGTLAVERQRLPVDVPQADRATLGGVIATNFSGPRRYGQGTIRDYVIGISAVDGRGTPFSGGGRVVKNVAGYDFCKLLCGSLGTLGVVTQVTLKLKPQPQASGLLAVGVPDAPSAEPLLAALVQSQTTPAAIELLSGPPWRNDPALARLAAEAAAVLLVGFEGTRTEVDWMLDQLRHEWRQQGAGTIHQVAPEQIDPLWRRLIEFPAADPAAAVLKANVLPSALCGMMALLQSIDSHCSVQAHAGNGIVLARMASLAGGELSQAIVKKLQPAARQAGGSVVVLAAGEGLEATRQVMWGSAPEDLRVMQAVKQQFDPFNLLNPGRFVYGAT
jgi:glycolate oxidase FAD binding subunit